MEALSFISVSIIEYVGVYVAILALFRYQVNHYWPQILFTSVICSVLSYELMVVHDVASAAMLIQLAVQIICTWLMFNTPLLWSLVMFVSFFIVYLLFQGGIIYVLFTLGFITPILPKTGLAIYLIQLFCATVCFLLGQYLQRKRIGFLFIPTSQDEPYVWSKTGRWLFAGSVVSFIAFGIFFEMYTETHFQSFYVLLIFPLVASVIMLYMMKRKNTEYVQKTYH